VALLLTIQTLSASLVGLLLLAMLFLVLLDENQQQKVAVLLALE
jgi:hypothetical protein